MKKLLTILVLLSTASIVLAAAPVGTAKGGFCPPGYIEKDLWMCTDNGWVLLGHGNPGAKARVWTKDTTYYHACNREEWCCDMNNEASVAQWMELHSVGDGWHWGVRKVGCYTANGFSFDARSNGPLVVTFEGFEDLTACLSETVPGNPTLPVEYCFTDRGTTTPPPDDDPCWMGASELNDVRWVIPDTVMCNGGFCKDIWSSIETYSCTPCANYHDCDGAEMCLTLQCIQPWIDRETGDFARMPDFPLR
jgi:hypothetical protein